MILQGAQANLDAVNRVVVNGSQSNGPSERAHVEGEQAIVVDRKSNLCSIQPAQQHKFLTDESGGCQENNRTWNAASRVLHAAVQDSDEERAVLSPRTSGVR